MSPKQLFISIMGTGLPKGEIRREMFSYYNSKVGTSKYFPKWENQNTGCGSCIQRVKTNLWKWYHHDEKAPNYKGFVFTGKLVAHNMPLYTYEDGKK